MANRRRSGARTRRSARAVSPQYQMTRGNLVSHSQPPKVGRPQLWWNRQHATGHKAATVCIRLLPCHRWQGCWGRGRQLVKGQWPGQLKVDEKRIEVKKKNASRRS